MVTKALAANKVTFNDFKTNPLYYMEVSNTYERSIINKYGRGEQFTWYGTPTTLKDMIKSYPRVEYAEKLLNKLPQLKNKDDDSDNEEEMGGNYINYFVISVNSDTPDIHTDPDEPATPAKQGVKRKSAQDQQKIDKAKKQLVEPSTSQGATKSKKGGPKQKSSTKEATRLKDKVQSVQENTPTTTGGQQIQTEQGNDHNERGSLVGEAGNRKIQKSAHKFGIVKVSNMSRSILIAFASQESAQKFEDIVECVYGQTSYEIMGFKTILIDDLKVEHTFYWVCLKLGFNMGYATMKTKFGKAIMRSKYILLRNIPENFESHGNEIKEKLKITLQTLFENDAGLTTFAELLELEAQRKQYNNNGGSSQPPAKRSRISYD